MSPKRILLVDDEDDIRESRPSACRPSAAGRSVAPAAAWTITKALAEQPDAILLDVMMPDLDGPATLQRRQDGSPLRGRVLRREA